MIVLHPSSRCDVCLEPYTWNTTSDTPHAIPCGHIFCKACLRTLSPSLCPLCRKAFLPDRAKRLHLDRPPENAGAELELDFLQRLALVSGDHAPPENVEEIMTEVQNWLDTQLVDSNQPLRAACDAIARHQALKDKYLREKAEHKDARRKLRHNDREAAHDRRTARAVEERLLNQLQELENEYMTKIEKLEGENAALRSELERYRRTSNPLPPPPKPLPADRFPPFVAASLVANSGSSSQPPSHPNAGVPNVSHSYSEGAPYMNGYVRPSGNQNPAATTSGVRSDAARTSDRESGSKDTSEVGQHAEPFRLGSKRTQIYASQRTAPSPPPAGPPVPPLQPHSHHSSSTHRAYPYTRSQSDSEYLYRNGIIPGAIPAQRIIPPPPRWPDTAMNPTHKPEPANLRGWGEMIGNGQWGQVGESSNSGAANATVPGRYMAAAHEVPKHLAPAEAFVSGYGSGLERGYAFVNEYPPATSDGHRRMEVHESPVQQEEELTGGLGLMNVPAPRQPGSVSPETNGILHRHISTATANRTNVQDRQPGSTYGPGHRRHGSGVVQPGTVRNSRSSWGTVESREATRSLAVRGSMSELGLIGLQGVAGRMGSVTESLLTTPVRLGHENGFMGSDPVPNVPRRNIEDDDDDEDEEDEEDSDEDEDDALGILSRETVERHNQGRNSDNRRSSSQDQVASNPSTPTLPNGSVGGAGRSSGEMGNALALDFNPSLSSLDTSRPRSPQNTSHSHITAPTPIVSRRNIMSNWRLENE